MILQIGSFVQALQPVFAIFEVHFPRETKLCKNQNFFAIVQLKGRGILIMRSPFNAFIKRKPSQRRFPSPTCLCVPLLPMHRVVVNLDLAVEDDLCGLLVVLIQVHVVV